MRGDWAIERAASERLDQAKSSFLRLVSHELRTPLSALKLQLARLSRGRGDLKMTPAQSEVFARMTTTSTRLTELVESLLAYARVANGRWNAELEVFDPVPLVREALDELRPEIRGKPLTLELSPCPEAPLRVMSDPRLLRLILRNLIGNAVKFSDRGRVDVSVTRDPAEVRFIVQDTGPGIASEEQARIFQPFEQVGSVESKHLDGFGLGLALTKHMVSVLEGRLDLQSVVGVGTTFVVAFPTRTEAAAS
jgi:signal transduction histidine kinase